MQLLNKEVPYTLYSSSLADGHLSIKTNEMAPSKPAAHTCFVAEIFLPELSFQIPLFPHNSQVMHKNDNNRHQH